MYSTTVSIKALQKFLTSHLVGGTAIACMSAADPPSVRSADAKVYVNVIV
jgi:hypothetical protein